MAPLLLCGLLLGSLPALAVEDKAVLARLALHHLAMDRAVAQIDTVISQASSAAGEALSPTLRQQVQQRLLESSGRAVIEPAVEAYLMARLPADTAPLEALLDDELLSRVGNFDVSLEMRGAVDKFRAFQQQLALEQVAPERLQLLARLDRALQISAVAATVQTELEVTATRLVGKLGAKSTDAAASSPEHKALVDSKRQLREEHMAAVLQALNLYSYRFLQDDELARYVALLERDSIQALVAVCREGLQQALVAARVKALSAEP